MLGKQIQRSVKTDSARLASTIFAFVLLCGSVSTQVNESYFGDSDMIVFPGPSNARTKDLVHSRSNFDLSKSLQLAKEINSIQTAEEFLSLVKGVPDSVKAFSIGNRMGETEERSNGKRPPPAACIPELRPISLKQDNDPGTFVFPSCTRVNRCGGCCSHELLSCQPESMEIRNFEVIVSGLDGRTGEMRYQGKRIVPVDEHTKCKCDCRITEEQCTEKQRYVPSECSCVCNNQDEARKCDENKMKIWDFSTCSCKCSVHHECSTGFYFDQNTCRCRQFQLSRSWFAPTKGADYRFGQTQKPDNVPPVIVALDAGDPRRKPKDDPEYK